MVTMSFLGKNNYKILLLFYVQNEEVDGSAVSALRRAIVATLVSYGMGDQKFIITSSSVLRKAL
jgi:hypothetical protein